MPSFSRILLKLSGEILREGENAFAPECMEPLADAIARVHAKGVQVGIVVGGGNLLRGRSVPAELSRADADQAGMLATILNTAMLRFHLEAKGVPCRVFSPRAVEPVSEAFHRARALSAMEAGKVLLLGGGTGNPFFSTDSAAALRAIELECEIVLKGTLVDGVYDDDPHRNPQAKRFDQLSFDEVIRRDLRVMDQTAIALCRDHGMKIMVFDITDAQNLVSVVEGKLRGTVIC
jgi:uridylate kinase